MLIMSVSLFPTSFASVESEAQEDIQAGCREGQILIHRLTHQDYVCVDPSTAISWERLGIAEIIYSVSSNEIDEFPLSDIQLEDLETSLPINESDELIEKSETISEIKTNLDNAGTLGDSVETQLSNYPQIFSLDDHIWLIVDSLGTQSIIIEGDDGLIVIDTPNSYDSTKKVFEELNEFPNKDVKHIILTRNHTGVINSVNALLEEGDGNVEIIIPETLLEYFKASSDWTFQNTITFDSEFTINTDLNMELIFADGNISHQTYIFLSDYDSLIIGDSVYGVAPFILRFEYLQSFFDFVDVSE